MESQILFVEILREVRNLIDSPYTDVTWSSYNTTEEVLSAVDIYIIRLTERDNSVLSELKLFFAPTGPLQDISINSGWSNKYLDISSRFDDIIYDSHI
ncbi:hypothetical protein [Paenibacillus andongensis]|uniref:hypothetical protein n=1 Tax=Paenibacillus andongensis TaxID=2975482 RepID=UPI0021BB98A9|nr:hypothetical protein [Paenibacillus andongensis]